MRGNKKRGYVLEHEVETFWKAFGAKCKRVFASGQYKHLGDDFQGDVQLEGYTIECKRRKEGFKELYKWLQEADFLVVRSDRNKRLYVLPEDLFAKFAAQMKWGADNLETEKDKEK